MKSVVLRRPGCFELVEMPTPSGPAPGNAVVRVHRIGVCGTDIHAFAGKQPFFSYPRILGHELGVEVVAVAADVHAIKVGDRCAVEPYLNCGTCIACRRGKQNCCVALKVLGVHVDGGHREWMELPAGKLHRSATLDYEQLALVETLGIGAHAVSRAHVEAGEWALVIGAGPIGLATLEFVRAAGARPIVLDVNAARLAFCRESMGVAHTFNAQAEESFAAIEALTGGDMATAVFDATGNGASMKNALRFVAHGGRLVFAGLFQGDFSMSDPDFHRRETSLLATRNALPADFQRIIRLIEDGTVDTRAWVTHRATLGALPEVFSSWVAPDAGLLKALISP